MEEAKVVRSATVDWLRAIGIVLVVYGHSEGAPPAFNHVVFAFHVPLFFYLSGYVLKREKAKLSFRRYLANVGAALLPAYALFGALGYLAWLIVLRHFGEDAGAPVPAVRPLLALFYGSGSRDDLLQPMVLWFFPCLLVSQLLLWPLLRIARPARYVAAGLLGALGLAIGHLSLPWEIETACVAVGMQLLGHEAAQHAGWRSWISHAGLPGGCLLLGLGVALAALNARVDLRTGEFGHPLAFHAAALCCVAGLFALLGRVPGHALVRRISSATLIIFPLHPLLFSVLSAGYVYALGAPLSIRRNPWVGLLGSLAIIAVLTIMAPIVRRPLDCAARRMRSLIGP